MRYTDKIKRLMTLVALLLGAVSSAWPQSFQAKETSLIVGRTGEIEFSLTNSENIYGLQADIQLPDGLEFDNADGSVVTLSDRAPESSGFSLTSKLESDNKLLKIILFSASHTAISGTEGVLLTAKVKVADDFAGGNVSVSNVILTAEGNQDEKIEGTVTTNIGFIILVESIKLSDTEWTGMVGQTKDLAVTVLPENATDKTIEWTSSDASIATVDADGKVTAVKVGDAIITAKAVDESGVTAECAVTVEATPVESITLDKTTLDLTEGDAETLTAEITPTDATDKAVTWTSSDATVASVDADGKVTAIKAGTATITATSANGKTASCTVTVAAKVIEVSGITLNTTELNLTEEETAILTATVTPTDATDKTVTWTSSDATIATVDTNGKVTAIKAGTATITATSANGKTASCTVTVATRIVEVTAVTLNKTTLDLTEGEAETLTAEITPTDATDKTVTWTSSDATVASVDADGKVTAIKAGTATITATSANGKTASCTLTVTAMTPEEPQEPEVIPVSTVFLSPTELSLTEGESATLTATVTPADATDKTLTWSSSDAAIATVDATGKVTAVKAGTATITATSSNGKSATCAVTVTAKTPEEPQEPQEPEEIPVSTVLLSPTELTLTEGESATLTATVTPADATDKTLTWSSSDAAIATVDATGKVTAVKAGTATITATSSNGKTATCTVTVTAKTPEEPQEPQEPQEPEVIPVSTVLLSPTELTLTEGESATLTATVTPADATDKTLIWSSSDAAIATVDANGKVTAVKAGTATITATSSNGKTASCTVTVTAKAPEEPQEPEVIPVSTVLLSPSELTLTEGESATLTATVTPADATDKTLIWSSSDAAVATVDANGKVTAVKAGTASITATSSNGKSATCTVTVTAKTPEEPQEPQEPEVIPVSTVLLSPSELSLTEGESATLTATVAPVDATDKTLTWSSSDADVATVDATGKVTAVKAGTATITATSSNGKTSTCAVTVTAKAPEEPKEPEVIPVSTVLLSPSELTLTERESATLTATVTPTDATDKTLTWSSSDPAIATVDATGKVTAVKAGTATITATSSNGKSATCAVTVTAKTPEEPQEPQEPEVIPVSTVLLSPAELSLIEGESATLTATVTPADATDKTLTWSSSDPTIATVDATGKVTAVKAGTATITATSSNGKTASCTVTVTAKAPEEPQEPEVIPVATVLLSINEWNCEIGDMKTIKATVLPENATDKTLNWTSDNPEVATVDAEGRVTAIAEGTAVIKASAADGSGVSAECRVTVIDPVIAESLVITPTSWSGEVGDSFVIDAVVLPEETTNKNLVFESSDVSVATVDEEGTVVIVGEGSCVIIVSTTDCSRLTAQCVINCGSSVEGIISDPDKTFDVYDMWGVMVKHACYRQDLELLNPGVYLIFSGSATAKIVIR